LVDTIWFELKCENNRWWRCSPKKSIWALYKGASDTRNWKVREHQGTISKCLCLGKDLMHCHALPKLDKLYRIVIYASLIFFIFDSIWFYLILFVFLIHCVHLHFVFLPARTFELVHIFDMIGLLSSWCDSRTSPTQVRQMTKVQRGRELNGWAWCTHPMKWHYGKNARMYTSWMSFLPSFLESTYSVNTCPKVCMHVLSCMFCRIPVMRDSSTSKSTRRKSKYQSLIH
jgi:hypothetical protein